MRMINILKPGLFLYECIRVLFLAFILVFQLPETGIVPWVAFASPGTLFPLMTLFLWLDVYRFRPYLPLYIAGKSIGIFSILIWFIFSRQVTIIGAFYSVYPASEFVFLCGDLFATAAALLILINMQNSTKQQTLTETADTPDTEDKQ